VTFPTFLEKNLGAGGVVYLLMIAAGLGAYLVFGSSIIGILGIQFVIAGIVVLLYRVMRRSIVKIREAAESLPRLTSRLT
jgi:hypothetical protein